MFILCELSAPHLCPADESIPPGMSGTVPDFQKSAKSRNSVRLNKKFISKVKVTVQKKKKIYREVLKSEGREDSCISFSKCKTHFLTFLPN